MGQKLASLWSGQNEDILVHILKSPCSTQTQTNNLNLKYELRLVASDNLNENYTTIVIHVNDVNDNPPVFDRPTYETQITEEDDRMLPKRVLQVEKSQKHIPHFCFCSFSS